MLERAQSSGVDLRGQTKTHKTVEGGILQTGGTKGRFHLKKKLRIFATWGGGGQLHISSLAISHSFSVAIAT